MWTLKVYHGSFMSWYKWDSKKQCMKYLETYMGAGFKNVSYSILKSR